MKKPIWFYASNQFLNSTKKNYRKALKLSLAHDKVLLKKMTDNPLDPDWTLLYNRYHPLHTFYFTTYTNWKASGGTSSGDTMTLNILLKLIPKKLDQWIASILPIYDKATAKFKSFFPQGRTPFETGKIDDKITAIKTLSTTLNGDVTMEPTKHMIDTAYNELDAARGNQAGGKLTKTTNSDEVEKGRILVMDMQLADTGFLINKYYTNPRMIEPFFDLLTLRSSLQSYFTRKMATTENSPLTKNTFTDTDEIRGKVAKVGNDTDKVTLYLGSTLGGIDSTGIDFMNNTEHKFTAAEFKVDLTTNTFLTAVTDGNITSVKLAVELY